MMRCGCPGMTRCARLSRQRPMTTNPVTGCSRPKGPWWLEQQPFLFDLVNCEIAGGNFGAPFLPGRSCVEAITNAECARPLAMAEKNEQFAEAVSAPQRFPDGRLRRCFIPRYITPAPFWQRKVIILKTIAKEQPGQKFDQHGEDYRNLYSLSRDARYRGVAFRRNEWVKSRMARFVE